MTNPFDRTLYLGYDIDDRVPYATYGRFLGASRDAYVSAFIFFEAFSCQSYFDHCHLSIEINKNVQTKNRLNRSRTY